MGRWLLSDLIAVAQRDVREAHRVARVVRKVLQLRRAGVHGLMELLQHRLRLWPECGASPRGERAERRGGPAATAGAVRRCRVAVRDAHQATKVKQLRVLVVHAECLTVIVRRVSLSCADRLPTG